MTYLKSFGLILVLSVSVNVMAADASESELAAIEPRPHDIVADVPGEYGVESTNSKELILGANGDETEVAEGDTVTVEVAEFTGAYFAGPGACPAGGTTRASYYGTPKRCFKNKKGKRVCTGDGFGYEKGKLITANGERYLPGGITAAHRSWRFNLKVRVTNLRNGKSTIVRINDRGPYARGKGGGYSRNLDLSTGAAQAIGAIGAGVATVRIEPVCD